MMAKIDLSGGEAHGLCVPRIAAAALNQKEPTLREAERVGLLHPAGIVDLGGRHMRVYDPKELALFMARRGTIPGEPLVQNEKFTAKIIAHACRAAQADLRDPDQARLDALDRDAVSWIRRGSSRRA